MAPIRTRKRVSAIVLTVLVAIVSLFLVFPILYMGISSFKFYRDIIDPSRSFVFLPTLQNYVETFQKRDFLLNFFNSVIVVLGSISVSAALGIPIAYSLARTNLSAKTKVNISFWFLSMLMLPPAVFVVPMYILLTKAHLLNTYIGLIITYTLFNIPFIVWLMRNYFINIPREIEEAAFLDGCSNLQSLLRIILPLSLPGLVSALLFGFVISWNEFLFAFAFTGVETATLPLIPKSFAAYTYTIPLGLLFAQGVMIALPVVIIGTSIQRYFVRGLSFGAIR